jgi:hypothetical protein
VANDLLGNFMGTFTAHSILQLPKQEINLSTYKIFRGKLQLQFISDEYAIIAMGKDNPFKVIYQVELASCIQRYHVYMCDKHQILGNDLGDTCLGALYLRSERGVQQQFRFERR